MSTTHTPAARTADPDTSHQAAASVDLSDTVKTRLALLALFNEVGPMTDVEVAEWYDVLVVRNEAPKVSPSGLRTRRAELADEGAVVDTGERRRLPSGRLAILWARASA